MVKQDDCNHHRTEFARIYEQPAEERSAKDEATFGAANKHFEDCTNCANWKEEYLFDKMVDGPIAQW